MNWRKVPINARRHPMMAGILRRYGKAGYCAYQWLLDLYAIHFDTAGHDVPLMIDHKSLKKELDVRLWADLWGLLRFVNDWPAVDWPNGNHAKKPPNDHLGPLWQPYRNQVENKNGLNDNDSINEYSSLIPKWVFWKDENYAYIFIPNFLITADDWTKRKLRENEKQAPDNAGVKNGDLLKLLQPPRRHDKRREDKKERRAGARAATIGPLFSQEKPDEPPMVLAMFLATACREIDRLPPRKSNGFNPWWFVKQKLHRGYHPKIINKGLSLAKAKWSFDGDLPGMVDHLVDQASNQLGGNGWNNEAITKALMPEFRRVLMPTIADQDEVKA